MHMMLKYIAMTAVLLLALVMPVQAVPVLDAPEQWVNDANVEGWVKQNNVGANVDVTHNDGGDYLNVNFNAQGSANPGSVDVVAGAGASSGNFVGNYTPVEVVNLRFYAEDTLPSSISLYFYNVTSGRTWQYDLSNPLSIGQWTSYSVPFGSTFVAEGTGWHGATPGYTSADFLADMVAVDWIGLHIDRFGTTSAEDYGLDDFELSIPEPGTFLVLLAALVPMAVTFRGQLAGLLSRMKGLIGLS